MEIQSYYWSFIQDLNMASSYLVSLSWWVRQPANIDWISWSVWFSHFSFSSLLRQSKKSPWWSSRGPYRRDLFSLWLWSLHCRLCEQCLHQGRGRGGCPERMHKYWYLKPAVQWHPQSIEWLVLKWRRAGSHQSRVCQRTCSFSISAAEELLIFPLVCGGVGFKQTDPRSLNSVAKERARWWSQKVFQELAPLPHLSSWQRYPSDIWNLCTSCLEYHALDTNRPVSATCEVIQSS